MTVGECVACIVIGLITGALSSWYVSSKFEKKAIEKEKVREFEEDKQQLNNFLLHVFDELVLIKQSGDVSRLVWILGSKPFCNRINAQKNNLQQKDSDLLTRVDEIVEEIREFCFSRDYATVFSGRKKESIFKWTTELPSLAKEVQFISYPNQTKKSPIKNHLETLAIEEDVENA